MIIFLVHPVQAQAYICHLIQIYTAVYAMFAI